MIIAEAQAREATKQASLNRVRGEIASMRNAEDLKRITPVIWRELKELEVPFIRCGVFIIDEEIGKTKAYLSTREGKALAVLNLKIDENKLTKNTVDFWKKNQVYQEHWNKEDFKNWLKSMMKTGQVQSEEEYQEEATAPESLHLHFIPFKQGMLEHSRTSTREKVLTDLNALADEYLRLSYHSLRAKDKSLNADFKTDFDASLPKVNIIPQDIGRVLLNLINNAFYAVNERRKKGEKDYEPSGSVTTLMSPNIPIR